MQSTRQASAAQPIPQTPGPLARYRALAEEHGFVRELAELVPR